MQVTAIFRALAMVPALLLFAAVGYCQPALTAASAHYGFFQDGKPVGEGDYALQTTSSGYTITSHGKLNLTKFSYSFTNTQVLDTSLNLVRDQLDGTVNGSTVSFTAASDSTGRQFQISISANGKQTQNTVDRHQHLVLLPDLDPAAYLLLAHVAQENPRTSWILIPKEDGILVPSTITLGTGVRGELKGSQINVQHATVAVNSENPIDIDIFYTPDGQVLEADLPQQNFQVVRDGFKLLEHPKESAPRAQPQSPQSSNRSSTKPSPQRFPAPQGAYPQTEEQ